MKNGVGSKRILAVVLCLCMMFTTLSGVFAFAEEPAKEEKILDTSVNEAGQPESGSGEVSPESSETPSSDKTLEKGPESAQASGEDDAALASGNGDPVPYAASVSPRYLELTVYTKEAGTGEVGGSSVYTLQNSSFSIGENEEIWALSNSYSYSRVYFYPTALLDKVLEETPSVTTATVESSITLQQISTEEGYQLREEPIEITAKAELTKKGSSWTAKYTVIFDDVELEIPYSSATVYVGNEFIEEYRPAALTAIESMVTIDHEKPDRAFTFELGMSADYNDTMDSDRLVGTYTSDPETGYITIDIDDLVWDIAQSPVFPDGEASNQSFYFFLRQQMDDQSGLYIDPTVYIFGVWIDKSPAGHVRMGYSNIYKRIPGAQDGSIYGSVSNRYDIPFENTTKNVRGSVTLHAAKLENGMDAVNEYTFNAYVWFEAYDYYRLAAPPVPLSLDEYLPMLSEKLGGTEVYPVGTLTNHGRDITLSYEFEAETVNNAMESDVGVAHFILFEDEKNVNADPAVYQFNVPLAYDEYTRSIIAGEYITFLAYMDLDAFPYARYSSMYEYNEGNPAYSSVPVFSNKSLSGQFEGIKLENGEIAENSYPFVMYKSVYVPYSQEISASSQALDTAWQERVDAFVKEQLTFGEPYEQVGDVVWSEAGTGRIAFPAYEVIEEDFENPNGGYYKYIEVDLFAFELPTDDPAVAEDPCVYIVQLWLSRDPDTGTIILEDTLIYCFDRVGNDGWYVYPEWGDPIVFNNRLNQNELTLQGTKTENGAVPEDGYRFPVFAATWPYAYNSYAQHDVSAVSADEDLLAWLWQTFGNIGTVEQLPDATNSGSEILFPGFELKPEHFRNPAYPQEGPEYYNASVIYFYVYEAEWAAGEHEGVTRDPSVYEVSIMSYYDEVTGKCWFDMEDILISKFASLEDLLKYEAVFFWQEYDPATGSVPQFVNGTAGATISGEKYENGQGAEESYEFELYYAAPVVLPPPAPTYSPTTPTSLSNAGASATLTYDDLASEATELRMEGVEKSFRRLAVVQNEGKDFVFPAYIFTEKDFEAAYGAGPAADGSYRLEVTFAVQEKYVPYEDSGMVYDRTIYLVPVVVTYDHGDITASVIQENIERYIYSAYSDSWSRDWNFRPSSGGNNVVFNNINQRFELKAYKTIDGEAPDADEKFSFAFDWVFGVGGEPPVPVYGLPADEGMTIALEETAGSGYAENEGGDIVFEDGPRGNWRSVRYDFYVVREEGPADGTGDGYLMDDTVYVAAVYWYAQSTNGISYYVPEVWYYRLTGNLDYVLQQLNTESGYKNIRLAKDGVWLGGYPGRRVEGLEYVSPEDVVFRNISLNDLTISKTVTGSLGDTEKEFTFTVTLTTVDGEPLAGSFAYAGDKEGELESGGSIKLKHGQSVTIHDLPGNTRYMVEESDNEGYTVTVKGNIDMINRRITASATFINDAGDPQLGGLTVMKKVTGSAPYDGQSFPFTVQLDDESVSGDYGMLFENGRASFELKDGESMTAAGLPAGIGYTVTEGGNEGYTVTTTNEKGAIETGRTVEVTFTNHKDLEPVPTPSPSPAPPAPALGGLTVSKTVTGSAGDKTKAFSFTVTLDDSSINGVFGDMEFTDGVAAFTLKHGESKTAEGLPAGVKYIVTESGNEGYTVTKKNDKGVVEADSAAKVSFTNHKSEAVKTGDDSRLSPWLLLMAVSLSTALGLTMAMRKRKAQ